MTEETKAWKTYEEVARYVLAQLRDVLQISEVAAEQVLPGQSGTSWNVEGIAIRASNGKFLILECKRYPTTRVNQEQIGGLAFRIDDTGADGAILVSPLPLQAGAKLVAEAKGIAHLVLTPLSRSESYLAEYLGQRFHGETISESVVASDQVLAAVYRDGKLVE